MKAHYVTDLNLVYGNRNWHLGLVIADIPSGIVYRQLRLYLYQSIALTHGPL